jgi:hypothetical protein
MTFTATAKPQSFYAVYNCQTGNAINVSTTNSAGNPITGSHTTLWQGGIEIQSCFSPCSFTVTVLSGQTYQVTVDNYGGETFSRWSDNAGTVNAWGGSRTVSVRVVSTTISLTAVYSP